MSERSMVSRNGSPYTVSLKLSSEGYDLIDVLCSGASVIFH